MLETTVILALSKSATLVFGALLAGLSWRAYRRTADPALRALAVGIGLVTAGAILGGALHEFLGLELAVAVSVQSVCTAAGFAVLTYSLYVGPRTDSKTSNSNQRMA